MLTHSGKIKNKKKKITQGGSECSSNATCALRWKQQNNLMSSAGASPATNGVKYQKMKNLV